MSSPNLRPTSTLRLVMNSMAFLCVLTGLAIAYYIQSLSKALFVILITHQELTIFMYHIREQLETLTDTLITLDCFQVQSLLYFKMNAMILLNESCASTICPLVEILLHLNPLSLFVWKPVVICKTLAPMSGIMWYHSSRTIFPALSMVQPLSTAATQENT